MEQDQNLQDCITLTEYLTNYHPQKLTDWKHKVIRLSDLHKLNLLQKVLDKTLVYMYISKM